MPLTGAERQKKYIEELKKNNPEKYEEKRIKHLEKVKQRQRKITELNDSEKEARRQKWKEANHRRKEKKKQTEKLKKEEDIRRKREIYAAKRVLYLKAENRKLRQENEKLHEKDKDDRESTSSEQDNIVPSSLEIEYISIPREEPSESTQPPVKDESRRKKIRSSGEHKYLQEAVNRDLPVEDRFDIFAKSVAVQLRELSFERSMIAQTRIQNILSELAIENYAYSNNMSASSETDNLII
ncbi:unnamed protein product [Colias eurytheme]|nr:unnamed protein product [Colias eurytheme]